MIYTCMHIYVKVYIYIHLFICKCIYIYVHTYMCKVYSIEKNHNKKYLTHLEAYIISLSRLKQFPNHLLLPSL